jgi:thermolysin metallopeptidase-like protein
VSDFYSTPEAHMTNVNTPKCGCCFIISLDVLRALAQGQKIETADRATYQRAYATTQKLRLVREGHRLASLAGHQSGLALRATAVAKQPVEHVFDCKHGTTLPGTPVPDPTEPAFKTVFDTTAKVAEFYKTVLGRNSVDNQGMDLVSSLNYDQDYQNAFWDGQQMVYGNGDNKVFIDFWRSPDVIGHELTHGVTQHESGLIYEGQSGALNESISDCFGAVFAQWLADKPASDASGWLIGAGIMGPAAKAKGFTCLRDMVNPSSALPQPAAGLEPGLRPDRRCPRKQRHCQPGLRRVRPEPRRQQLRHGDQGVVRRLRQRPFLQGDLCRFRPGHHYCRRKEGADGRQGRHGCMADGRSVGRAAPLRPRRLNRARPH